MTLFDYVSEHPWWTLVYLVCVLTFLEVAIVNWRKLSPRR